MVPSSLESSYRRYKEDTAIFLKWLVQTAETCGLTDLAPPKQPPPTVVPAKAGRLKGKARKEAQSHTTPVEHSNTPSEDRPVPINELVSCAEKIAQAVNPRQIVPQYALRAAKRAINMRKKSSSWFQQHKPSATRSNEAHYYFIEVLEKTLQALTPCIPIQGPGLPPRHEDKPLEEHKAVENMFENLELEEPIDTDVRDPSPLEGQKHKMSTDSFHLGLVNTKLNEEDRAFAAYCLFQDLNRLRERVRETWVSYKERRVDIMTAAMTTNFAIDLGDRIGKEFFAGHPSCDNYESTLGAIAIHILDLFGARQIYEDTDQVELFKMLGLDHWCFTFVYSALQIHTREFVEAWLPMDFLQLPTYDPTNGQTSMTYKGKYHPDCVWLLGILNEYQFQGMHEKFVVLKCQDEISRAIRQFCGARGKEVAEQRTIQEVFAVQILLDVRHCLGDDLQRGFTDSVDIANRLCSRIDDSRQYPVRASWPTKPIFEERFSTIKLSLTDLAFNDCVFESKMKVMRRAKKVPLEHQDFTPAFSKFFLQRNQPIFCGVIAFLALNSYDIMAREAASHQGHTLMACHLYNGLRLRNPEMCSWPDVEAVIAAQTEKHIFCGDPPQDPWSCQKRTQLAMGCPVSGFAKPREGNVRKQPYHIKLRKMEPVSPVLTMMYERYNEDEYLRANYNTIHLENVLGCPKLAPERVLGELEKHFLKHIPLVCFDHLSMLERLETLFGRIYAFADGALTLAIKERKDIPEPLLTLVQHMFVHADGREIREQENARKVEREGKRYIVPPSILVDVAELIEPFLKTYGSIEVDRANAMFCPDKYPEPTVLPKEPWLQIGFEVTTTKLEKDSAFVRERKAEARREGSEDVVIDATTTVSYSEFQRPQNRAERRMLANKKGWKQ